MTNKQKHIALFLPSMYGGGAERVALTLTNEFIALGHRVDLVLLNGRGDLLPELHDDIRIVSLETSVKASLPSLISYLRRERPTALLANMWPLTWVAGIARAMAGVPCRLVVVEHVDFAAGLSKQSRARGMMRFFGPLLYMLPDEIVCVAKGTAEGLSLAAGVPRARITVIENPISLPAPPGLPKDFDLTKWWQAAEHRLLTIGRLVPQKDHATLIRAFKRLPDDLDARLLILGEGPERGVLEGMIRDLKLEGKVRLGGFQLDREAYLEISTLFVLSSRWEGFGNVLAEALLSGVPVVATDCPSGPREILSNGRFGHLVPIGDCMALAEAIKDNLLQPVDTEKLRSRGREFDPAITARRYLQLL